MNCNRNNSIWSDNQFWFCLNLKIIFSKIGRKGPWLAADLFFVREAEDAVGEFEGTDNETASD